LILLFWELIDKDKGMANAKAHTVNLSMIALAEVE
jgi:hypothetical protein